jgi:hypothetical protein
MAEKRELGLEPVLLTGDNERTARAADSLGIERVLANVLPDGKAAEIRRLREAGEVVAMVGDGGLHDPIIAAATMASSSIFVVTNSLRLRRFHSRREQRPLPEEPKARPVLAEKPAGLLAMSAGDVFERTLASYGSRRRRRQVVHRP